MLSVFISQQRRNKQQQIIAQWLFCFLMIADWLCRLELTTPQLMLKVIAETPEASCSSTTHAKLEESGFTTDINCTTASKTFPGIQAAPNMMMAKGGFLSRSLALSLTRSDDCSPRTCRHHITDTLQWSLLFSLSVGLKHCFIVK